MTDRLDPAFVRAQIENLRHTHPGIWDEGDETLLADMLEGETGLHEFLEGLDGRRADAEERTVGIEKRIADHKARRIASSSASRPCARSPSSC